MNDDLNIVGKRVVRSDSLAKVTGEAHYTGDLKLPNMLVAKVLRSPYPHAKIVRIDTQRALKVPGVKAAVSGFDAYGIKWGVFRYTQDHAMLPTDKVRYIGEDVAAVAAIDEETALEALSFIKVDYEPLPGVFDPLESMKDGRHRSTTSIRTTLTFTFISTWVRWTRRWEGPSWSVRIRSVLPVRPTR